MAIAKENDLVSSICIVKILYQEFLRYALFLRNVFCIWMRKTFRTLLFLCEVSHQQRNNYKWPSCKIQNIWCECSQRNKVLNFLLIQIQNTCRCRIRWERSLNCITSSIVTTLPEDYLLFIFLCFMLCLFPCDLYSDGDILLVLLRQRLILAVSPIFSLTHLILDLCGCHVLLILAVAVCRIGDVCCLPAPAHQPFSFNSLGLSIP